MKISKEEKALIKSYVNLMNIQCNGLDRKDIAWIENETTKIINNRNGEYRYLVEDYINSIIEIINKK